VRADLLGGPVARVPGAGDTERGHPAGTEQRAQRVRQLACARTARDGIPQAGQPGRVDHIQVHVGVERPFRQVT
jgi:hypothetical protein